jgi:hypothetical protein
MLPDSAFLIPFLGHHFVYAQQIYTFDYASPTLIYSFSFRYCRNDYSMPFVVPELERYMFFNALVVHT